MPIARSRMAIPSSRWLPVRMGAAVTARSTVRFRSRTRRRVERPVVDHGRLLAGGRQSAGGRSRRAVGYAMPRRVSSWDRAADATPWSPGLGNAGRCLERGPSGSALRGDLHVYRRHGRRDLGLDLGPPASPAVSCPRARSGLNPRRWRPRARRAPPPPGWHGRGRSAPRRPSRSWRSPRRGRCPAQCSRR